MNMHDGHDAVMRVIAQAMQPDPELHLDTWSEHNVVLPKGTPFPGPYRLSHTPYARRILQCLSPGHPAAKVVAMVASQMLKTQVFINAALGWIDRAPANILALEPTDKLAKRLSARIEKAVAACDVVAPKVAKPRSRDSRNTVDCKEFDGGALHIATAGSASNLAEIPARYLFVDEVDRTQAIAAEGHPVDLGLARLTAYEGISKAYMVSTPLVLGASKIQDLFQAGTREAYHVPCPHCGHLHALEREFFRYDYDSDTRRVHRAWFVCPSCGCEIEEHQKIAMLPELGHGGQARWVAQTQGDGETVSFWLPAYYAPLGSISWASLARQLARAEERKKAGDMDGLREYVNTREGLPFDGAEVTTTAQKLMARAEDYAPRTVPDRALVLTAFADTQPTRLEVTVEAWGPGLEHWVVDHVVLWGSPTEPPDSPTSVWRKLEELRRTPWQHSSGAAIYISAYGIDSGGANTQDVYNYAAGAERLGCVATKGSSARNRPVIASAPTKIDVNWQGRRLPEGVKLWMLGTDTAKDHLFNRLHLLDGPGAHHFHRALQLDYFEQLLAERPQLRWNKGQAMRDWVKANGARNEALDCAVGNLALAHYLGLHKWGALDWARLRAKLIPAQVTPDLFAAAPVASAPLPASSQLPVPAAVDLTVQLPEAAAPEPAPHQPPPPPAAPSLPPFLAPQPPPGSQRRILSRGLNR
jgi:phage terminase large subunit GpA-like protein